MNDNTEMIDARGLSCPQPVMLASQAINGAKKGAIKVLVDSGTARDNVARLAKNSGWDIKIEEEAGGEYRLILSK